MLNFYRKSFNGGVFRVDDLAPLHREVEDDDGNVKLEPVIENGEQVMVKNTVYLKPSDMINPISNKEIMVLKFLKDSDNNPNAPRVKKMVVEFENGWPIKWREDKPIKFYSPDFVMKQFPMFFREI